jgi:TetR/AcrR family transcriptional regulator
MDNRAKILSNALKLFAARGYDAVGTQEIVDAAGITKPTLYHYFGSKEGLLKALLEANFEPLYQSVRESAAYQHDLPLTLERVVLAYFNFADKHRPYYRMQLSMWFAPVDSVPFKTVAELNRRQQQLLETLFLLAAEDHGNMRGRHQMYAATFLGMINTYISLMLNGYASVNDDLVYKAVHQFMHGIFS